ncbi:unnamed protein product [Microthlaspi erraticum]|uniref:Uncharacterized protein n=1 Tax=Microthlaspi erraticum TaxID=1685480 RepID=A0A6D2JAZ4_9BRAS|nr:unnamed protein product [Microthlaspi erraticum]
MQENVVSCDLLNKTQQDNESFEVNGFLVPSSQVESVKRIFENHPDIASGVVTQKGGFKVDWLEKKIKQLMEKKNRVKTGKGRLPEMECEDMKALLEKEKAEVADANKPFSFEDFL